MKYEAVFGDQKRFNEQNNEMAEVMLWHDCLGPNFVSIKELSRMNSEGSIPHGSVVLAMRRIIAEPKRWTWEDKKAGLMPEVGAYVFFGKKGKNVTRIAEFIGVGTIDSVWCLKLRCGSYVFVQSEIVSPIETPEEKAQREEDEFISSLISVDIPVGGFFSQGARLKPRWLKGGE